jgi:hypothetical protein
MADYRQTVEEAARVLSLIHGEYAAALAYALRSGLAPALERAREEERIRMADVLASVHGIDPIPAPPPPAPSPTPPAFAPLMGCESSALATATAPEREPAADAGGRRPCDECRYNGGVEPDGALTRGMTICDAPGPELFGHKARSHVNPRNIQACPDHTPRREEGSRD